MKVVILAGGFGTRLAEETDVVPKPMIQVGGHPLLWHIMKTYSHHGFREFHIALGYKGDLIKRYFVDYHTLQSDMTVETKSGRVEVRRGSDDDWRVHLVDTGLEALTGDRLRTLEKDLSDAPFMVTYGDGVADVDLRALLRFHEHHGRLATVTAVRPPARFGELRIDDGLVTTFTEKPQIGEGWINGGFLVFSPGVFRYKFHSLEVDLLGQLAADRQLTAYKHDGFWQCMDTLRDLRLLRQRWDSGTAPWKVWS